jgi:hypothetical protein
MGVRYRVRQFVRALSGPVTPPDLEDLGDLLTARQKALFSTMAVVDQNHCLAVARALEASGRTQPDLLQAALMHDIGKSAAHIAVWERVAHVLLLRGAPRVVGRLGSPQHGGLGHGLYVLAHQAALGADLAAQAGCSETTVALIRGAGDPALQRALRQADDTH